MRTTIATKRQSWSRRPRFAPKQLLDAERLNAGFDDELDRQRLLNRALYGWGVVFGYRVEAVHGKGAQAGCVAISCGLALDPHGRMLYTPDCHLSIDGIEGRMPKEAGPYTLLAHFAERVSPAYECGPCPSPDPQWTEHGVVFTLRPGCAPVDTGCPPLPEGECLSHTDYVRRRLGSAAGLPGRSDDLAEACERPGPMVPTECETWRYDADAGVPIACLEICELGGPRQESSAETCLAICDVLSDEHEVVRCVYRNPLLYELIDCCDVELARIERISWHEWHDSDWQTGVPWSDFAARVQATDPEKGFAIWFTRPIRADTLHDASVFLTAIPREPLADYWIARRIPMRDVVALDETEGLANGVQLLPTWDWLHAEVTGTNSSLFRGARFEVTLRGQLLRDECGQMLDARPPDSGGRCQERPGDDFVSVFEVGRRPEEKDDYLR